MAEANVLVPLALSLFGFVGYWWAHYSTAIQSWFDTRWSGDDGKVKRVFTIKLWGFITMGVIPATVLSATLGWSLSDLGVTVAWRLRRWSCGCGGSPCLASTIILSMVAGKEGAKNYPQIRATEWSLFHHGVECGRVGPLLVGV